MTVSFKFKPDPTFRAKVLIPVAGVGEEPLVMEFKHRTKDQLQEYLNSREGVADVISVMEIACGWELIEPFDEPHVRELLQNYVGAAVAIVRTYVEQLTAAKAKN